LSRTPPARGLPGKDVGVRYKSEIFEAVHTDALANFEVAAISEAEMREFDEMCLGVEAESEQPPAAAAVFEQASV